MVHSYKLEAIILKRTNFSEADRLITVFSKTHGKLKLLAKGIRKPSSRKKGHLELFNLVKLQVASTKSIDLIIEAETLTHFKSLGGNLNRVRVAYLIAELIDQLTAEEQEQEEVFDLLLESLDTLNSSSAPKNFIPQFEASLLELLGFGLPDKLDQRSLEAHIHTVTDRALKSKGIK